MVNKAFKSCPNTFKFLAKWRNFAKSGHTGCIGLQYVRLCGGSTLVEGTLYATQEAEKSNLTLIDFFYLKC